MKIFRPPDPDPPRPALQPEQQHQPGRAAAAAKLQQTSLRLQSAQPARCRPPVAENICSCRKYYLSRSRLPRPQLRLPPAPSVCRRTAPRVHARQVSTEYLLYLQTVYYVLLILSTLQRVLSGLKFLHGLWWYSDAAAQMSQPSGISTIHYLPFASTLIMLLQATIIRNYFVKTQTSVASFGPPNLCIIFSNGMYLDVSPL